MTGTWTIRETAALLLTVLLATCLPAFVSNAPTLPTAAVLAPGVVLAVLVGIAIAGYQYGVENLDRFGTVRVRALLYAVCAFYVTAAFTFALVGLRLGGVQVRRLPVVAWTVLSSVAVALLVRQRVRSRATDDAEA